MSTVRVRLLLVEDDARSARMLAEMLEEDGYEVAVAYDVAAALQRLSEGPPPDVLIIDLMLHGLNGLTVVERARQLRADMAVIFVTSYPEILARSARSAAQHPVVLTKPVSYEELRAELGRVEGASEVHS